MDVVLFIESVVTTSALVIGGLFAYFRFIKGRVFAQRAVPSISGEWEATARPTLRVSVALHNVGASRLTLLPEGTGIRVHTIDPEQSLPPAEVRWRRIMTADAFVAKRGTGERRHETVEAGEHIDDELLLDLQRPPGMAVMLELWVGVDRGRAGRGSVMARCVVAHKIDTV
ncbi:hypothetical protein [Microbacterium sp. P02]|uniref:hypothetical protein n=1 Tax=Microbacterium sp. P02 TaxID=3366260 RepID=UPI00367089B2